MSFVANPDETGGRDAAVRSMPDIEIPQDWVFHALRAAERVGTTLWTAITTESLTITQYVILADLRDNPGSGNFAVADRVGIDRSTMGPLIRRMEASGFIHRAVSSRDRRRSVLTLLAPATDVLVGADSWLKQVDRELLTPLPPEAAITIREQWSAVSTNTAPVPEQRPPSAYLILRSARRRQRWVWAQHSDNSMSASQFALLHAIERSPGSDLGTIAHIAAVEETTAVRILMRLVRTGFADDDIDPADRRRTVLDLTDLGSKQVATLRSASIRATSDFLAPLEQSARGEFVFTTARVGRVDLRTPHQQSAF